MTLTPNDLRVLLAAFDASEWDEMTLVLDRQRVELSKTGRAPAGTAAASPTSAEPSEAAGAAPHRSAPVGPLGGARLPAPVEAGAVGVPAEVAPVPAVEAAERQSDVLLEQQTRTHRVTAPSVGVFWRAPDPSAPPFVEVGQRVEPTDPVCIVEVMKLFNHVQAGASGTVRSIEVDNGAMVEHGQTLFVVELEG